MAADKPKPKRTAVGQPPKARRNLDREHAASMRLAAESRYVFHDQGYSTKAIADMPEFKGIPETTIAGWCVDGGWVEKRKAYLGRLRQKLEAHVAGSMVQQRKNQLAMYDKLRSQLLGYVLPDADGNTHSQPKSTETVIAAILKLDEASARTRKEIQESMGERMADGQAPAPVPSEFDPQMAQKLAHVFMATQLEAEAKAAELKSGTKDEGEAKDPK